MILRKFDRVAKFDDRSRDYPVRAVIQRDQPRSYTWRCGQYLDQGQEGACVGFGWTHEIAARPNEHFVNNLLAERIYNRAKQIDEYEGEDYDGTSVLAGVKAATEEGFYSGYRWAFGLQDVLLALAWKGPVVIGVNWYVGMYDTDKLGYLHPVGDLIGGHCTLLTGINVKQQNVRVHNSWGPSWGRGGDAFLSWTDLGKLLADQGEACIPEVRK